ncbi:Sorbin and SH3 domain-containing protein 1, partial [Chytriomyces hyalinus]
MTAFVNSFNAITSNPNFCPSGANAIVSNYLAAYSEIQNLSTASTCVVGETAAEKANCGFISSAEATTFCATSTDACCAAGGFKANPQPTTAAAVAPPAANTGASPPPAAASSSSGSNSGSTSNSNTNAGSSGSSFFSGSMLYIVAGGGVALLLIIGALVFCFCRKKKVQQEPEPYGMSDMGGKTAKRNDSAQRLQPAPLGQGGQSNFNDRNGGGSSNGRGVGGGGYNNGPPPSMPQTSPKPKDTYTALFNFTPQQNDELQALYGDKILLKKEFDDGWGFGINLRTKKEGSFPLDLLDGFADPFEQQNGQPPKNGFKDRSSSIFGPPQGMMPQSPMQPAPAKAMSPPPGVPAPMKMNNVGKQPTEDVRRAVFNYAPIMQDEIEIFFGDKILVKNEYDDGWAFGKNLNSQREGLFPQDCVGPANAAPNQPASNMNSKPKQRMSSLYGAPAAPLPNTPLASVADPSDVHKAVFDFKPTMGDELELRAGDKVKLKNQYDDGWAYGMNLGTKKEGLFPLDILAGFGGDMAADKKTKQRVSSMMGVSGAYGAPAAVPAKDAQGNHTVVSDFDPEMPDEIELRVGDKVKLTKEFDDGWGTGRNLATNLEGLLPLDCLSGFDATAQIDDKGQKKKKERMSSIYGAGNGTDSVFGAVAAPAAQVPAKDAQGNHTATSDFDPEMADEVELRVGDKVKLKQEFDDGWGIGLNLSTNMEGLVPLDCLSGFDGNAQMDAAGQKKKKERMSSIYGAGGNSAFGAPTPAAAKSAGPAAATSAKDAQGNHT